MNELIPNNIMALNIIERLEDKSDAYCKRLRVYFRNGFQISIVFGQYTYGNTKGLFELAIIDPNGNFAEGFDDKDHDGIVGHCSIDDLNNYLLRVGTFNGIHGNKTVSGELTINPGSDRVTHGN